MKRLILLSFVILAVSSCGNDHHIYRTLKDIGTYISDSPDSAYNVLSGIDKKSIFRVRTLAKYSLLMSIALDKKYIDVTEDTLIRPAVLWYERHGSDKDRMLAYYYHGRVYQNAEDYNHAIIAFSNAEKYAKICADDFYLGMIYRGMYAIYNRTYNHHEELKYAELSRIYFKKSGHNLHYYYSLRDIALTYNNLKEFDRCLSMCDTINRIVSEINDTVLYASSLETMISALIYKKNNEPEKAIGIFNFIVDSLNQTPSFQAWTDIAEAYAETKQYDTADDIIRQIKNSISNNSIADGALASVRSRINFSQKDYKNAFLNFQKTIKIQDSLFYHILNQSVINTQKDYFKRQAEYDAERLRMKNTIILLIVIASVVTLASISYFWYRKVKDKEREKEFETARLMDRISEVRNELISLQREKDEQISSLTRALESENQEAMSGFREQIYSLYQTRFRFFDNICRQYYSFGMTASKQKQIFKVVEENIREVSDDKEIVALEEIVDAFRGGVMKKLRAEFPRFKEEDFKVMCYWYAGFSPTAMCVFMKVDDINDIYKRKSRLKARIEKSESPNKDFFISQLPKLRE